MDEEKEVRPKSDLGPTQGRTGSEKEIKSNEDPLTRMVSGPEGKDLILISKNTWLIIGLLITIFNPLPAGLIFSLTLWKEKKTAEEGKRLVILSLFWGAISLSLALKYYR